MINILKYSLKVRHNADSCIWSLRYWQWLSLPPFSYLMQRMQHYVQKWSIIKIQQLITNLTFTVTDRVFSVYYDIIISVLLSTNCCTYISELPWNNTLHAVTELAQPYTLGIRDFSGAEMQLRWVLSSSISILLNQSVCEVLSLHIPTESALRWI